MVKDKKEGKIIHLNNEKPRFLSPESGVLMATFQY
jgi:hypothetical protein